MQIIVFFEHEWSNAGWAATGGASGQQWRGGTHPIREGHGGPVEVVARKQSLCPQRSSRTASALAVPRSMAVSPQILLHSMSWCNESMAIMTTFYNAVVSNSQRFTNASYALGFWLQIWNAGQISGTGMRGYFAWRCASILI